MANESRKRIEAIYHLALEKGAGEERSAYLDSACADSTDLRAALEGLLKAHDKAGDFLESPIVDSTVTLDETPLPVFQANQVFWGLLYDTQSAQERLVCQGGCRHGALKGGYVLDRCCHKSCGPCCRTTMRERHRRVVCYGQSMWQDSYCVVESQTHLS